MKRLFQLSLATLLFTAGQPFAWGADAFFSPDGKTVTTTMILSSTLTGLVQIDVATGKATQLPLPPALKDAEINSIARGAEGEILFLANDAVWVLKQGEAARKVAATSPVKRATGLFVDTRKGSPTEDWIFVSGVDNENDHSRAIFYARKPGGKKFESIFCRRVDDAIAGVFSADGRLFFVSSADMWEGGIEPDTDVEGRLGVLIGARLAPLAFLNTDEGNGGGMWVRDVCPAGKWLYSSLRGRHMAAVVRTPMPAKALFGAGESGFPTLKASFEAMSQAISKTEIISDDIEDSFGFCATEVEGQPRVFFYMRSGEETKGPALMLWNGSGAPKAIGYLPKRRD